MKKLLSLLPLIILFSCEEQVLTPDPPKCMECTTVITYGDGKKQTDVILACDYETITKSENLNYTTIECGELVIYKTTCLIPDCKGK
jgi:hypothetical protein